MANNLTMAVQGTSYTEGDISLAWGSGPGAVREVIHLPPAQRPGRLLARISAGYVVETDLPITEGTIADVPIQATGLFIELSAPPSDGQSIVFNADSGLFDPAPKAANIAQIDLPENATPEDVAQAFNDVITVLIDAGQMEPPPS